MKTVRFMQLMLLAVLTAGLAQSALAQQTFSPFRGIERGDPNHNAVGRGEWWIDITDSFDRGGLSGSLTDAALNEVDGAQVGFVPPTFDTPIGPLTGAAADAHGRWMGSSNYEISDGAVRLVGDVSEPQVACLPWRATRNVGDEYLVEMDATVAPGESVRMGYFGELATHGSDAGLTDGGLGQLVLEFTRDAANTEQIEWKVSWLDDMGNLSTTANTFASASGETFRMQLGWSETGNSFDAWVGDMQLAGGPMDGLGLDVFGVGFELTGQNSQIDSFLTAVPEPSTYVLMAMGLIGLAGYGWQQRRKKAALGIK